MVVSSLAKGARKVVSSRATGARQEGAPHRRALVPSMPALIPVSQRRTRKLSVVIDDAEDNPPEKPVLAGDDEGKHDGLDRGEWPDVTERDDSEDKAAETDSREDEIDETVDSSKGETVPYYAPVAKRNKHRARKYEGTSDAGHGS
ncbi:unnamed protein product [Ectocarpus sp. CCAP 1310/34]|nr:unnamed protein product [Ectocarpus sp. CCAP 1310/34]